MTWLFEGKEVLEFPEGTVGFVYLIVNQINGRKYIGKKLAAFSKTTYKVVKLKNGTKKKKRIKSKVPSDWQEYWSSSDELKKDIEALGQDKFTREILYYCRSKSECSYVEAREQIIRKVLESDEYYNSQIQVRVHKNHIKGKI